jgi:hypothetical protein
VVFCDLLLLPFCFQYSSILEHISLLHLFLCWMIFHCMTTPHCVYLGINWWTFRILALLLMLSCQEQWLMPVIPSTLGVESARIIFWSQPRQKVSKTPSQQTSCAWWDTSVIPATWGIGRSIVVGSWPQAKVRSYLKDKLEKQKGLGVEFKL